jgi:PhnB protein
MAIKPVPEGFHTVTPYLVVKGANALVDFITRAFGGKEVHLMKGPKGEIRHGDLIVGDSHVMLGEADGPWPPQPTSLYVYLPDCDAVYRKALAAGGTSVQEPKTQFYGDRHGAVKDPCGNTWWIATHVEDVSPQEMDKRAAATGRLLPSTAPG